MSVTSLLKLNILISQPLPPQVLLAMRTMLGIGLAGTTIGDTLFLEVIPKSQRGRWMMALGLFWVGPRTGHSVSQSVSLPILVLSHRTLATLSHSSLI